MDSINGQNDKIQFLITYRKLRPGEEIAIGDYVHSTASIHLFEPQPYLVTNSAGQTNFGNLGIDYYRAEIMTKIVDKSVKDSEVRQDITERLLTSEL